MLNIRKQIFILMLSEEFSKRKNFCPEFLNPHVCELHFFFTHFFLLEVSLDVYTSNLSSNVQHIVPLPEEFMALMFRSSIVSDMSMHSIEWQMFYV